MGAASLEVIDYGVFSISTTAATLFSTASPTPVAWPKGAESFAGKLEVASVRVRGDGTAPTSSEGELWDIGDDIILTENQINDLSTIVTGATDAKLRGHFYRGGVSAILSGLV